MALTGLVRFSAASASNWFRAAISASHPLQRGPATPYQNPQNYQDRIAGGLLAITRASLILLNAFVARSIMANGAVLLSRSLQSFRRINIRATFPVPCARTHGGKHRHDVVFSWVVIFLDLLNDFQGLLLG